LPPALPQPARSTAVTSQVPKRRGPILARKERTAMLDKLPPRPHAALEPRFDRPQAYSAADRQAATHTETTRRLLLVRRSHDVGADLGDERFPNRTALATRSSRPGATPLCSKQSCCSETGDAQCWRLRRRRRSRVASFNSSVKAVVQRSRNQRWSPAENGSVAAS
jgi:hypothetical protein